MDDKNGLQIQFKMAVKNDTTKNPKIKAAYSWPVIILACIIFWPVGLFLLWRRTSIDKKASLTVGKVVTVCGFVCLAFSLLGFSVSVSEGFGSDDVSMIIFLRIHLIIL
jgi:hypothetical protein